MQHPDATPIEPRAVTGTGVGTGAGGFSDDYYVGPWPIEHPPLTEPPAELYSALRVNNPTMRGRSLAALTPCPYCGKTEQHDHDDGAP